MYYYETAISDHDSNQVNSLYSVQPWLGAPNLRIPTVLSFEAVTKSVVDWVKVTQQIRMEAVKHDF